MMNRFKSRQDYYFDIINHGLLLLFLLIVSYPLLFVVSASISDTMAVVSGKVWLFPKGINFEAYEKVFRDVAIITGYKNTVIYTVIGTLINLAMTIIAAYPLSRKDLYGRNVLMFVFTFTMYFQGGLIPTYLVVKDLGMVNSMWALILPGAVSIWVIIIMRTYFQSNIPNELYEASAIDGCSNLHMLFTIVLPLSSPIIAVSVLMYAVVHWNSYFSALVYITEAGKYPLQMVLRQILIQNQLQNMQDAMSSITEQIMVGESIKYAVIIVASLPVLILYPFLQKYFVKGIMIGAIKG